MDLTDFEDFMDFFRICSGFFDEVYGIFGVKCPSVQMSDEIYYAYCIVVIF